MKKNPKNSSVSVQPQLSQQQATPLSTLTLDELESVQGGWSLFYGTGSGNCRSCGWDNGGGG